MADEIKNQRIITLMTPSELESIDEWMFKNRLKSRGEAIRRLCHLGMRAGDRERDLLRTLADALDREAEILRRVKPDSENPLTAMETFEECQRFLREVYALAGSAFMEDIVLRTAPSSKIAIDSAKEIAERLKAMGSTKKQVEAFLNFAGILKADRQKAAERKADEEESSD
jgi:hypothetical protein